MGRTKQRDKVRRIKAKEPVAAKIAELPDVIDVGKEAVLTMSNLGLQKQLLDQNFNIQSANIQKAFSDIVTPIIEANGITMQQWAEQYDLDAERGVARRRAPEKRGLPGLPAGQPQQAAPPAQQMN